MPSGDRQAAKVAVIIVNYRTPELTKRCLSTLHGEKDLLPELQAIVVDGGSADGSAEGLRKEIDEPQYRDWVKLLPLALNGGFGWANNQAILALAREKRVPDFVHLLNPDAEIRRGAVATLARELQRHPQCGAVGSLLLTPDGDAAASAFRFPSPGRELVNAAQSPWLGRLLGIAPTVVDAEASREVDWVTGASVMLRTKALREAGLFDDGFFLYFEEVELMHRLWLRGWTVRHVPESRVVHIEGASTGVAAGSSPERLPAYWYESRRRYYQLTSGGFRAIEANLGWIAGSAIRLAKRLIGRPGYGDGVRLADLLRVRPSPESDAAPSVPQWGDSPGKPPAWMAS